MSGIRSLYPGTKNIFLDANILVLLVVGQVRPDLLAKISPGNVSFDVDDFELIVAILKEFENTVTTPYILAEVNNLLLRIDHNSRIECREKLGEYISLLTNFYTAPIALVKHPQFKSFGIADISILHAASKETLILTEDGPLIGLLQGSQNGLDYNTLKLIVQEDLLF